MNKEQTYEVLARKYRPQSFSDVVGQDHVIRTLSNAIKRDRVAHAYLFVGPRGTGKTSTARIFAKALNCEQGPTDDPCNSCDNCREITEGSSLDVLEIDGASNNGVEQVRELRENVRFMPAKGRYKIFIIDEVHMLTTAAFNALLKTLEEPPSHVKFFFATTEAHKVPATILSRCQRFDLRRIAMPELVQRLTFICEQEEIHADQSALFAIARGADGGLRDAQSALDQMVSFQGKNITEEDVLSVFGLVSGQRIHELVEGLLKGDGAAIMAHVNAFDEAGKDLQRLLFDTLEYLRNVLVLFYCKEQSSLIDLPPEQMDSLKQILPLTDADRTLQVVDHLVQVERDIKYALSPRTLLELGLLRAARSSQQVPINKIIEDLDRLKHGLPEENASEKKNVQLK